MAAEIKPRAEVDNRVNLEEVIPLDSPFTIFIDPSDACNFQCSFCPTGDRKLMKEINRKPSQMSLSLFKKIIDDIETFPKPIKILRLHKDGEPLLNKNLPEMIKYAKQSKNILKVDTTTNASLLTPEKNIEIIKAGIDRINVSIEGMTAKQYLNISKYKIDFEKLIGTLTHLYNNKEQCEISIKIPGNWLSVDEKNNFIELFQPIADRIFIENINNCWPGYEINNIEMKNNIGVFGNFKQNMEVCPYIFYSIVVNADGTISACCVDWEKKLILGDTNNNSIKDIWNGKKLRNLQILHLNKKRHQHLVCKKCQLAESCSTDNIDKFSNLILERLT